MSNHPEMMELVHKIRGTVLQAAIELEWLLDVYISQHFAQPGKVFELLSMVITPRLTFENKAQVFRVLVDKSNPELKWQHPKYYAHIVSIIEERNVFAHLPIDLTSDSQEHFANTGQLTFVRLKNSTHNGKIELGLRKLYGEQDSANLVKLIRKYCEAINKLLLPDTDSTPKA